MHTRTSVAEIADPTPRSIAIGPFGSSLKADMYELSGIPVVRGQNIGESPQIDEHDLVFVSQETADRFPACMLSEGDLVFPHRGAIGRVGIVGKQPMLLSSSMMKLRCDRSKVDPLFMLYYFRGPGKNQLLMRASTVGTPGIGQPLASLRGIPLEIPSLPQQEAIAEVLGALDDKITANSQLVETASQFSNALFKASLTESAVEAKLSEVCTLLSRGITPKYSEADDSMIVLNQKCVRQQRVDLKQSRRTEFSKVREEKILLHDDVLVNSTGQGTLGRVARWTFPEKVTVDSHITILRFDPELVNPVCGGFAVLRSEKVITSMAEGSTGQTELSRNELGKLKILLPPPEKQNALGQELSEIAAFNDGLIRENQRLSETRDTLLPQLMSGKIRVREAESIVEGVL
ncbi:restriction endonuclease subunit S [Corynebacterium glutamicum]|uniref:restriction endonuclease subunit S n=1 Tax=Corynebacterium glutamicum TaxID=1718 RepID=UPI0007720550|nr:restriction endonuclease subunit S [Corynebacterium glutamicum]AMK79455.1 hypothetical protein APT58_15290 [Corynebacterium glutamicum]